MALITLMTYLSNTFRSQLQVKTIDIHVEADAMATIQESRTQFACAPTARASGNT